MKRLLLAAALALGGPAAAQDGLADCRAIEEAGARLACYDALPATSVPAPAPEHFGKPPALPREPDGIQTRLAERFTHFKKGTLFRLENGQVWRSVDDSSGYYPNIPENAAVTITKSWSGAYWMVVEPVARKIKVHRIQ